MRKLTDLERKIRAREGEARMVEARKQMRLKKGPYYDHWRQALLAALSKEE